MDANLTELIKQFSDDDAIQSLAVLMSMDDENFALVAPSVMDNYLRSINAPSFQLAIAQSANAGGSTVEELMVGITAIIEKLGETDEFSPVKRDFLQKMFIGLSNAVINTQGIAKRILNVPFEKISKDAKEPIYAHVTDSGADIFAAEDLTIDPGETKLLSTGLKVQIPAGYELQIRPKSGISLKTKLRIANSPATVDEAYRGEVGVIIDNIDPPIRAITVHPKGDGEVVYSFEYGRSYTIEKGQKIAQFVLAEVPKAHFIHVDKVDENTDRKDGAYGSTGLV